MLYDPNDVMLPRRRKQLGMGPGGFSAEQFQYDASPVQGGSGPYKQAVRGIMAGLPGNMGGTAQNVAMGQALGPQGQMGAPKAPMSPVGPTAPVQVGPVKAMGVPAFGAGLQPMGPAPAPAGMVKTQAQLPGAPTSQPISQVGEGTSFTDPFELPQQWQDLLDSLDEPGGGGRRRRRGRRGRRNNRPNRGENPLAPVLRGILADQLAMSKRMEGPLLDQLEQLRTQANTSQFTPDQRAADLAPDMERTSDMFGAARGRLEQNLTGRGLTDSSAMTSGMGALAGAEATAKSNQVADLEKQEQEWMREDQEALRQLTMAIRSGDLQMASQIGMSLQQMRNQRNIARMQIRAQQRMAQMQQDQGSSINFGGMLGGLGGLLGGIGGL